ncbi:helix-turn-helix transcriptional regulator [Hyphomonas sp.]|uniref:helix-turn-helix transcriptional regulator n=1 Tax=Hyphomonas sp. TaxID=87 RepID=UPI000C6682AC|nr:helix-turn-helix transcriptional regulator [Hyphomonas sp.]MAB11755.1 transcriptional regulator [Hyphomonas sp.]MBM57696.1 transcriptional regulator [Hyphomonas sp.]
MSKSRTEWETLGQRLKIAREYLDLSQDEAANAVGLPRSAISLIENGRRKVDAVELARFSDLYSQSIESLTGRTAPPVLPESVHALARAATELSDEDREQLLSFAKFLQNRMPGEGNDG